MPRTTLLGIAVFAAVGCGLMGGLLFTSSNFVMRSLARQPPESGIRTMQAINVDLLNPLFLLLFMGTALASVVLVIWAAPRPSQPGERRGRALLAGLLPRRVDALQPRLHARVHGGRGGADPRPRGAVLPAG